MKKVLSILLVLTVLISTVSVVVFAEDAALGTYDNPYQLIADSMTPLAVSIPAGEGAYIKASDANNSVVTVGHATSNEYVLNYPMMPLEIADDGTVEFTMNSQKDWFYVANPTDDLVVIYIKLAAGTGAAGAGTMDNPEEITLQVNPYGGALGAYVEAPLAAGNEGHWYSLTAPADGIFMIGAGAYDADYNDVGWIYFVNNITKGSYGDNHYSDDAEPVWYEEVAVSEGDELQIFIATYNPENMWTNPEGTANVNVSFAGVGSMGAPAKIEAGDHTATLDEGNQGYYYQWTATEEGTATITINTADGWLYSVNGERADGNYIYGDMHWSDDDPVVASEDIAVMPGDVLEIFICTYDPANMFSNPAGSIDWTLSFVAGDVGDIGGGDIGGGDEGDDDEEIPECNFIHNGGFIIEGTYDYPVDFFYAYTLYTFEPEKTGKYTFTSTNSAIGLVSTNGMWITAGESSDYISDGVVTSETFEWTCTSVGQSIWVAVLTFDATANITVDYEEVVIKEIPRVYHENATKPEAFDFTGNADDLLYVDTFDAAVDTAVLGTDGYYHLNSADGPILYADLNDALMSLEGANSYGQLKELTYENGECVLIYDFTEAMIEYLACMDEETGLYPLTDDLMAVFQKAGSSLGWYGAEGWVGGELEDCWMFACYYLEGEAGNVIGGGNADGNNDADNNNDNSAADNNNGTNVAPSKPTGDSFMIVMITAMIALCGMATVVIIRKRRMASK